MTLENTNLILPTQAYDPRVIEDYARANFWSLDVDDCLYDIACGLHAIIKANIVREYNNLMKDHPQRDKIAARVQTLTLASGSFLQEGARQIRDQDLGVAFGPIVQALREISPDTLHEYLDQFYGDHYDLIQPNPTLIRAFEVAATKNIEVYLHTNGISNPRAGKMGHVQRALLQLGATPEMVEAMRARIFDLLLQMDQGFAKPSIYAQENFLTFAGKRRSGDLGLMCDDSPANLVAAHHYGLKTVWTWTSDTPVPKDLSQEATKIGAYRVRHPGDFLLSVALAAPR